MNTLSQSVCKMQTAAGSIERLFLKHLTIGGAGTGHESLFIKMRTVIIGVTKKGPATYGAIQTDSDHNNAEPLGQSIADQSSRGNGTDQKQHLPGLRAKGSNCPSWFKPK